MYQSMLGAIFGALSAIAVLSLYIYEQQMEINHLQIQVQFSAAEKKALEKSTTEAVAKLEFETKVFDTVIQELLVMCTQGRIIKLSNAQYRCYQTYDM